MNTEKLLSAAVRSTAAVLFLCLSVAAGAQPGSSQKASFELVADRSAYGAGEAVRLAAVVEVEERWHINSHKPAQEYLIPTELVLDLPTGSGAPTYIYPPDTAYQFPFETEPVLVYDGRFNIVTESLLPDGLTEGSLPLTATLRYQACDDRQCVAPTSAQAQVQLTIGAGGQPINAAVFNGEPDTPQLAMQRAGAPAAVSSHGTPAPEPEAASSEAAGSSSSLPVMLFLALLGGFILNAMPCVLPVLSLKVFGLVKSAGEGRSHLVAGALATTAGILVSFWGLALAAVLAAKAGAAVGWGVQFQQPGFVTFLAVVVVLFSLNMWGLFEIPLPQSLARLGGTGPREGLGGHFASGLFATLMATPCSAPFLGTAVGFALAQPAYMIFVMFTAIGLGLALPYLLLAAIPAASKWLPKPGQWMITFRQVMGFLLAAAAVWLFYVLAGQISPERIAFVQLALLALALFVWLGKESSQGSGRRRLSALGALGAAVLSVFLAAGAPPATAGISSSAHLDWIPFDEAQAQTLAEGGQLVFVDFTADWCLTCKATERLVLETEEIATAFEEQNVVAMKGDWTNRDDTITEFLARYGRSAVPFYVLFRPGQAPHAFGELLTKGTLIEVLEASAVEGSSAGSQAGAGS